MYGLASDTDVSGFIGQELQAINLGKWQVLLRFEVPTEWVAIEADYSVDLRGTGPARFESATGGIAQLAELLTRTVVAASVENNALRLTFDDASVVEVYDSESRYESYNFSVGGSTFVV